MNNTELNLLDKDIDQDQMVFLLLGKGPSSKTITVNNESIILDEIEYRKPKRLEIGSVNDAWKEINQVDYSFITDYRGLTQLKEPENREKSKKHIKRLVIPSYPLVYPENENVNISSRSLPSHVDYNFHQDDFKECVDDIPYYLYQVESSPINNYNIETFPEMFHAVGTGYLAVCFALARGFRHFLFSGFDPDMIDSEDVYNKKFKFVYKDREADDIMFYYQICYLRMIEKIIGSGCTYQIIK